MKDFIGSLKWQIFSQTTTEESGQNKKNPDFSYWAWSTP
jgi:hypothetical protein